MGVSKVIINGSTVIDVTQDTVASSNLLSGYTATGADGEGVSGSIVANAATDITLDGNTVTVPAGYYASSTSKTIPATTHPDPTVSVDANGLITASHTQTAGYVAAGTTTDTLQLVTSGVSAANIKDGATVKIGDSTDDDKIANVTGTFTDASTVSSGQTAAASAQIRAGYSAWVDGAEVKGSISDKAAATYNTSSSDQVINSGVYLSGNQTIKAVTTSNVTAANVKYNVVAKVGDANDDDRIVGVTGTFTGANTVSSGQTAAAAGNIVTGYSAWVNGAEVKGSIPIRTSANMTVSDDEVTAPAGYYATAQSKSVAAGSATVDDATITANPSISVSASGLITATNNKTEEVTPTVTPGYVVGGTPGVITVSGSSTSQLTTKAAATYTPGATDQTIAAGQYLTGAQTVKGDANLIADNIADGVTLFGITGTHVGGYDTSDATATAADILAGMTAYIASGKVTGTFIPYLEFIDVSVAFSAWSAVTDNTVGYGEVGTMTVAERWRDIYCYRASITNVNVTDTMFAYVEYSANDSVDGYFGPFIETYNGGIYIYAVEPVAVTIPKVTVYRRS